MYNQAYPLTNPYAKSLAAWLSNQSQRRWYEIASRLSPVRYDEANQLLSWMVSQPNCELAIACEILWSHSENFSRIHDNRQKQKKPHPQDKLILQLIDRAEKGGFPSQELGWMNGHRDCDSDHVPWQKQAMRRHRRIAKATPGKVLDLPDCLTLPVRGQKLRDASDPDEDFGDGFDEVEWNMLGPSMMALGATRSAFTATMKWPRSFAYNWLGWTPTGGRRTLILFVLFPALCVLAAMLRKNGYW
jgi:hypothetical protein